MADITLRAAALTARDFDPFGEVIETAGHTARWINDGSCERFDDLARVDVLAEGGRPLISIFRALPQALPFRVRVLERHPLSSQAFIPLNGLPFLVIVAEAGDMPIVQRLPPPGAARAIVRGIIDVGDMGMVAVVVLLIPAVGRPWSDPRQKTDACQNADCGSLRQTALHLVAP